MNPHRHALLILAPDSILRCVDQSTPKQKLLRLLVTTPEWELRSQPTPAHRRSPARRVNSHGQISECCVVACPLPAFPGSRSPMILDPGLLYIWKRRRRSWDHAHCARAPRSTAPHLVCHLCWRRTFQRWSETRTSKRIAFRPSGWPTRP